MIDMPVCATRRLMPAGLRRRYAAAGRRPEAATGDRAAGGRGARRAAGHGKRAREPFRQTRVYRWLHACMCAGMHVYMAGSAPRAAACQLPVHSGAVPSPGTHALLLNYYYITIALLLPAACSLAWSQARAHVHYYRITSALLLHYCCRLPAHWRGPKPGHTCVTIALLLPAACSLAWSQARALCTEAPAHMHYQCITSALLLHASEPVAMRAVCPHQLACAPWMRRSGAPKHSGAGHQS